MKLTPRGRRLSFALWYAAVFAVSVSLPLYIWVKG